MITEEQAKLLVVGDLIHHSFWSRNGECEVWRVYNPHSILPASEWGEAGWLVEVCPIGAILYDGSPDASAGIAEARMSEWHLPEDCPLQARERTLTREELEGLIR